MTDKEAREVLSDVSAYLASRASLENEMLAGHTFTDICNAIKTLKQQPCEDCISREAVLEIQAKYAEHIGATKFWQMRDDIRALPSVTPNAESEE